MDQKKWRCMICGYVQVGQRPPSHCPICGVSAGMFEEVKDEDKFDNVDKGRSNLPKM